MDEATRQLSDEVRADLLRLVQEHAQRGAETNGPEAVAHLAKAWEALQGLPDPPGLGEVLGPTVEWDAGVPSRIARTIFGGPKVKPQE